MLLDLQRPAKADKKAGKAGAGKMEQGGGKSGHSGRIEGREAARRGGSRGKGTQQILPLSSDPLPPFSLDFLYLDLLA